MSFIIGITGGIGSGKSVVSSLFRLLGVPVYDCDKEAKRIMHQEDVKLALNNSLGVNVYNENGLNRKLLASLLFKDSSVAAKVNAIVHPAVTKDLVKWANKHDGVVAFESAILFECGLNSISDKTLMVYAPKELRISRVISRDNSSKSLVLDRMNNQMDDEEKKKLADIIILNDDKKSVIQQVNSLLLSLS